MGQPGQLSLRGERRGGTETTLSDGATKNVSAVPGSLDWISRQTRTR